MRVFQHTMRRTYPMMEWIRGFLGSRDAAYETGREKDSRNTYSCGQKDHVQPRSSDITFDRVVNLVVREHGETLRELADR